MELLFAFLLLMTYHLCFLVSGFETTTVTNGTTDHLVLLSVKSQVIDDPSGALNSWGNRSFPNFCQRYGATCGLRGQRRGRVTALNLPGLNLSGLISPAIANLTFLKSLHLPKNQLYGSLPHELGLLLQLNHLDLSFNSLNGEIPSSLSYCSNLRNISLGFNDLQGIDSRGNDFKALIFEFLPNENLEKWLHNREEGEQTMLDLNQRVSTAIDVASALDYLHHKPRPIVHCDLKPSNVILDDDLVAHVGDFGLARFLWQDANSSSQNSTSWGALRGTIGYVAPEYGIGNEVSIYGDIYSYGILLLELFTAKRPTDDAFKEDLSLHQYVEMALQDKAIEVIDQSLLLAEQHGVRAPDMPNSTEVEIACITSALRVGIQCSKEAPTERMQISDALRELQRIRDKMHLTRRD